MRRRPALFAGLLGIVVIALIAGTLWVSSMLQASAPECTVPRPPAPAADDDPEPLALTAVQLQHASTINAVGLARGLPERARVIALATAWQESSLRNLDYGDRDSVGLFQQRESQGWGAAAELQDPVFAAGAFYDALVRVDGWESLPLTEAAQRVQRSGHPDAYAKWEWDAQTLAEALDGSAAPRLSCRAGATASTRAAPVRDLPAGADALPDGLAVVVSSAAAEFGSVTLVPANTSDAHSVTVTIELPDMTPTQSGQALAAWAVAHATSFGIDTVAVAADAWSRHTWGPAEAALPAGIVYLTVTE